MNETLSSEYAKSATLLDRPFSHLSPYFDKCYIAAHVTVGENAVDINVEGAPLVAHDDSWREKSGLKIPTRKEVADGLAGKFSLISGGTLIALQDGETFVTLRRDDKAFNFANYLVEPSGCCGETPSKTISAELNEELFVLKTVGHEHRIANFVDPEGSQANFSLVEQQAQWLEGALALKGISSERLLNQPLEPVAMKWNAADFKRTKTVTVRVGSRKVEQFKSLVWLDEADNTLALRRSMIVDISRNEIEAGKVTLYDGDGYGRHIVVGDRKSLSADLCTPFLSHYLTNSL